MRFRYYLYCKNNYYYLFDRKLNRIKHKTITFESMYYYIKNKDYTFSDIVFKHLTLYDFFKDYAKFDDEVEKI